MGQKSAIIDPKEALLPPGVIQQARPMAIQIPDFNQTCYVYTAGPMGADGPGLLMAWRDRLPNLAPGIMYLHPRVDGARFGIYFPHDLIYLDKSNMLVVYLNAGDAPRTGTAFEMGRAHAMGKPIILIDERKDDERYNLIRQASNVIVHTFEELEQALRLFLGEKEAVVFAGEDNEE